MSEHRKYDQLRSQEVPGKKELVTVCYSQNGLQEMTIYFYYIPLHFLGYNFFYLHYASLAYGTKAGLTCR